jgi:hypothetical protein
VHFLDKASRDLFICAKDLFIEAEEGQLAPLHFWLTNRINIPTAINRASRVPTAKERARFRRSSAFGPAPFCAAPRPNQKRSLSIDRTLAATNKYLAQSNKSSTDCEATKKRFHRQWCAHKVMTLQKAKSIARHLGLTLRQLCSGDYRVNFRDGNETTAYYTDKFEDAVNAVVVMARKRAL